MDDCSPDSEETQRLLEQFRAGDRRALNELLARHRPYLCQLVELRLDPRLRARVDPSDVVQEAQLEAVRRLQDDPKPPPMPFRLWLRQLASDRLLMLRRYHVGAARRGRADRLDAGRDPPGHGSWAFADFWPVRLRDSPSFSGFSPCRFIRPDRWSWG